MRARSRRHGHALAGRFGPSMTNHTSPEVPGEESLRRLANFARALDTIAELPCLAKHILSEFCRATRRPDGSLYLLTQRSQRFHCLAVQGSIRRESLPSTFTLSRPLVRQFAQHQHALGDPPDTSLTPLRHLMSSELACRVGDAAIPLWSRNRLIALVMLWSERTSGSSSINHTEILSVMAPMAANALHSVLLQEEHLRADTLMRCTDRLRSLEYMADSFAHAIRNPLTSIKTFIQLAGERKDDPQFVMNFSQMALDDVSRIDRLTHEMREYARYTKPKLAEEDCNDIVSSCLYLLDLTLKHRRIKIEKDLAPEPPHGMLDRQQLQQALLNLLFNAVEALETHGGILRVRTGTLMKPDSTVWSQINIEDTGHGISTENLEQIFDPFFTTRHRDGEPVRAGLGLTIARQIIEAHRGEILVRSTEGVGTVFSIHLPLRTV